MESLAAIETVSLEDHPCALVYGQAYVDMPKDLYIPPDALEVFLEAFEGPLDLLLYLIKRHNLDVLDIPIAKITEQYMEYIALMRELRFELAAEYLLMAASLAEIKSRMLLPRPAQENAEEEDPRAELVRRLQEYERFKTAAEDLDELPRCGRDTFQISAEPPVMDKVKPLPDVALKELLLAMQSILKQAQLTASHHIQREALSVRERMSSILERLQVQSFMEFTQIFNYQEGRSGVVVSFIALLELSRTGMIEVIQSGPYQPIHIKLVANSHG